MKKQRIFLTGGSGFIGRNVIENLSEDYQIFSPKHTELDLLNESAVETYIRDCKPDVVLNFANIGGKRNFDPSINIMTPNLRIFFNLVRCDAYFGKMIHLGSGAEYGKQHSLVKIKEEEFDRCIPDDQYGFYKYICSKYIHGSHKIVNLRLFGVFGKYEDYRLRFISNTLCKSLLGLPLTINQNVFFDYLYIDDLMNILRYFIEHGSPFTSFNVGSGRRIDLLTIAKIINGLSDKQSEIIVLKKGLGNEYTCDNSRLVQHVPGVSFMSLEDSIGELRKYYLPLVKTLDQTTL